MLITEKALRQHQALRESHDRLLAAVRKLMPLELVNGDAIQRLQPNSRQMLNTNETWAVTQAGKSGHRLRADMAELQEAITVAEALLKAQGTNVTEKLQEGR